MSSTILLIRHAETDLAGTFCGHTDPPINARGQQQIQALVRSLAHHKISMIYASDLQRALTTAQALADSHHLPLIQTSALREIHFGAWESLNWQQVEQRDPVTAQQWIDDYPQRPAPEGEAFHRFERRVLSAFDQITSTARNGCTAIVSHAGVLRVLLTQRFAVADAQARQQTSSYCSVFRYSSDQVQ